MTKVLTEKIFEPTVADQIAILNLEFVHTFRQHPEPKSVGSRMMVCEILRELAIDYTTTNNRIIGGEPYSFLVRKKNFCLYEFHRRNELAKKAGYDIPDNIEDFIRGRF